MNSHTLVWWNMLHNRAETSWQNPLRRGTVARPGHQGMSVTLEGLGDPSALARIWRDLEQRGQPSFFQSWAWIGCWLNHLPEEVKPRVLSVSAGGQVVGLAVLIARRTLRHSLIRAKGLYLNETGDPHIDPIGLALDNFDVTGRWRIKENGMDLDTSGEMCDGTPVKGPADLRAALLKRPIPLLRTFTENLMAYGLGRRVEYFDQPTIRTIVRQAAKNDYRISSFILGIVNSPAFQMKRVAELVPEEGAGTDGQPQTGAEETPKWH